MTDQRHHTISKLPDDAWLLLFAAWALSLAASFGALFIGEVMGQTPCLLCWYQRAFMFPLSIILGIALVRDDVGVCRYACPLGVIGALIAGYHILEYVEVIPPSLAPCTAVGPSCSGPGMTVLGWIPIPVLSFIAFSAISAALALAHRRIIL